MFTKEELNMREIFKSVTTLTTKGEEEAQLLLYANQWLLCSTWKVMYDGNSYVHIRLLDDKLIKTLISNVVSDYEIIEVDTFGIVNDGGWSNESYYNLITKLSQIMYDLLLIA